MRFSILPFSSPVRYCLLLIGITFCSLPGFSQQKRTYNLLWKISGKDLSKPSFVFGTMHVKDEKAFNFSDSVMLSIADCQAFALELHPDTMMRAMFESFTEPDRASGEKGLLTDKQYAELADRYMKKNGSPLSRSAAENPLLIESLMQPDFSKPRDKVTFVDAWLYGIAKTMNKNIRGLENTEDQIRTLYGRTNEEKASKIEGMFDRDTESERRSRDELVEIYSRGSLEEIKEYLELDDSNDAPFIERNRVMVRSIVNLMRHESVFAAVGAAHLPGDEGILKLLENAGYNVVPVSAAFTGVADKYQVDYGRMKWNNYRDTVNSYSIEVPTAPVTSNLVPGLPSIVSMDMTNEAVYGVYSVFIGLAEEKELIDKVLANYSEKEGYKLLSKKRLVKDGLPIMDISMRLGDNYMRLHLLSRNNTLYCLYVGNKQEHLDQVYSNRFFSSFKSFKPAEKKSTDWIDFKNEEGAFSVRLPNKPESIVKDVPNPADPEGPAFKLNMYMSIDQNNFSNYLIRYNDFPQGMYADNKDQFFESSISSLKASGKLLSDPVNITRDGHEGRRFNMLMSDNTLCEFNFYLRGNRTYLLMKQVMGSGKAEQIPADDGFFDSFRFETYKQPTFYTYTPDDKSFSIVLTAEPKVIRDSVFDNESFLNNGANYLDMNSASGGLYNFGYSEISKYYSVPSLDSLYSTMINRLVRYPDSLYKIDKVTVNGVEGREYLVKRKGTDDLSRSKMWFDNSRFYHLSSYLGREEVFSEVSNKVFSGFTRSGRSKPFDLVSSKAALICADLQSRDTTVYNAALGALSFYQFRPDELPVIYKALKNTYADDDSVYGVRTQLINAVATLKDQAAIPHLKSLYEDLQGADHVKAAIITALPRMDKQAGFDLYFKYLRDSAPLKLQNSRGLFAGLSDSLKFVAAHFNEILPLLSLPEYRSDVLALMLDMQRKMLPEYQKLLEENKSTITQYAADDLNKYAEQLKSEFNEHYYKIYQYLAFMDGMESGITNDFTLKLLSMDLDNSMRSSVVTTRIKRGLPTDKKIVTPLLDSLDTRYEILKAYHDMDQMATVPSKYSRQDEFARLCLYTNLWENDSAPEKISLLGSAPEQDSVYYVFAIRYTEAEEKEAVYRAIIGPFKSGASKLDFDNYSVYTDWEPATGNWKDQVKAMIRKLKEEKDAEQVL